METVSLAADSAEHLKLLHRELSRTSEHIRLACETMQRSRQLLDRLDRADKG